jgi:hypothetical protein
MYLANRVLHPAIPAGWRVPLVEVLNFMNLTSILVIVGVVILAVILIALVIGVGRSVRTRKPALKTLSPEARDRYAGQWDRIETHFVDAPEDAVKEADGLLLAMLSEQEHPLRDDRLPSGMQKARKLATGREGKGGTEGMRLAMLQYRQVIEEYAGPAEKPDVARGDKRQIAS